MRRRGQDLDESFDLFLDTITNAFGGIVLITLLIVLMIRENNQSAPDEFSAGPAEEVQLVESQIISLEAEKTALAANLQVQQRFVQDFQSAEVTNLTQQLSRQMIEKNLLDAAAAKLSLQSQSIQRSQQGLQSEQQQLELDLAAKTAEFEALNKQLHAEQISRTRTMALPKERATIKSEVPVFLENGQLFIVNNDRTGERFSLNTKHFEKCSLANADLHFESEYLRTIAGAGIHVDAPELKQTLSRFSTKENFLTFVVRSDSFESFSTIRDQCVCDGFEYRIIATDEIIGQGGGSKARTQ